MKIALLGAGRIGAVHGALLAADPAVSELIVADVDAARARDLAAALNGRFAPDVASAIADADAVVVAAATGAHAQLVRLAIDRGVPVFCEKPLAFDLEETIELVELTERRQSVVQVGFQRRFDAAYVRAHDLVARGDLGTVYLVKLIAHDHEPPPDAYIATSGGLFRDSSIHDFDALRWMTGVEVEDVYATGSVRNFPVFAKHDDVDTAAVILRLTDGTLAVLSQTRQDPVGYDVRMEVTGSLDSVTMGIGLHTPLHSLESDAPPSSSPWQSFMTRFEGAYRAELLAFLRVARGELPSPCTTRDGLEAMRIAMAAGLSLRENRLVRLSEIATVEARQ